MSLLLPKSPMKQQSMFAVYRDLCKRIPKVAIFRCSMLMVGIPAFSPLTATVKFESSDLRPTTINAKSLLTAPGRHFVPLIASPNLPAFYDILIQYFLQLATVLTIS